MSKPTGSGMVRVSDKEFTDLAKMHLMKDRLGLPPYIGFAFVLVRR